MIDSIAVRSLMYNKDNKKYIKAIDDRDFSNFIELLIEEKKTGTQNIVYDFNPIINHIHDEIKKTIENNIDNELKVKHSVVYNSWIRLKTFENKDLLNQATLKVISDSEETINWIHARLPTLKASFRNTHEENTQYKKNLTFEKIMLETEVFVESILCNIHSTALVDIESLKKDTVLIMHAKKIYSFLMNMLREQAGYLGDGRLHRNNIIEQCCMENMDISPETLLFFLDSGKTKIDIIHDIFSRAKIEDCSYGDSRIQQISWTKANFENIRHSRKIIIRMSNITSVINLLEHLKKGEIKLENDDNKNLSLNERVNHLIELKNTRRLE